MKYTKIIISGVICLVCIVAFCFVAITGKIYKLDELPLNFMGAFLSAMVTAVLTLFLLNGQSNAEEIKERNVIVFKKKSVIFEKFINLLYKVLRKQKINGKTYRKIKSEFDTKLVLYLKKESQWKITDHLAKLAECIRIEMNDDPADLNDNYYKLRGNIFSIINILIDDIGLGGNMNINMQTNLEKITFPYLFNQTLLEEINNLFMKKNSALFKKASYNKCIDGLFIIIPIKGKITPGGRIEIGPFSNNSQGESFQKRLVFRLLAPQFNPLAESYASCREANIEGKYINFYSEISENESDEYDQIDLTYFENRNLEKLERMGFKKEVLHNHFIYQFGFDNNAYTKYCGFYVNICKVIAARAYFSFFTARTAKDYIPIKELCEKFGEVTNEEITDYIAYKQGTDLDE